MCGGGGLEFWRPVEADLCAENTAAHERGGRTVGELVVREVSAKQRTDKRRQHNVSTRRGSRRQDKHREDCCCYQSKSHNSYSFTCINDPDRTGVYCRSSLDRGL